MLGGTISCSMRSGNRRESKGRVGAGTARLPTKATAVFQSTPDDDSRPAWNGEEIRLLLVEDLARILRLAPQTIYNRRATAPETLPPSMELPGTRGPRWDPAVVAAWQRQFYVNIDQDKPRRRGRPSKSESMARRAIHAALRR
jgi:hypothetical protein